MKTVKQWWVALGLFAAAGAAQAETVSVAVAANFTDATRDIIPLFEQATGHEVKVSFGSTGKLYAQIENGAPFEVFLAADSARPLKAENEGLGVPGSRFTYARGALALWSPNAGTFEDGPAYLKQGDFHKLAIANPKTAPYGLAAQQAMEKLGVWPTVKPKVVRGDSIAQTFQFAATATEAGFVALSQVRAWKAGQGSEWVVPAELYDPIDQQAILLKTGESNPAAKAFLDFLKGGEAQSVITAYGYGVE